MTAPSSRPCTRRNPRRKRPPSPARSRRSPRNYAHRPPRLSNRESRRRFATPSGASGSMCRSRCAPVLLLFVLSRSRSWSLADPGAGSSEQVREVVPARGGARFALALPDRDQGFGLAEDRAVVRRDVGAQARPRRPRTPICAPGRGEWPTRPQRGSRGRPRARRHDPHLPGPGGRGGAGPAPRIGGRRQSCRRPSWRGLPRSPPARPRGDADPPVQSDSLEDVRPKSLPEQQ